jgi:hypothetical protein
MSTPNLASNIDNELELGPLFVFCKKVSIHGGGESALGTHSELRQRDKAGGLVDTSKEILFSF